MDQSISRDNYKNYKVAGRRYHHDYTLPAMLSFLPSTPCTMLDAGCGDGYLAGQFSKLGHAVTAIDISHEGVALGRAAFPNVTFRVASVTDDLHDLSPPSGFDVIVSCEVIEHLYSPNKFLQRAYDLLRPGGLIIITTPYHGYWKNLAISLKGRWDFHWESAVEGAHIKFFSKPTLFGILHESQFVDLQFRGTGRLPYLWKGMVVAARKPD